MSADTFPGTTETWPENADPSEVIRGEFTGHMWPVAASWVNSANIPKYHYEDKVATFGPLEQLVPEEFDRLAEQARTEAVKCKANDDIESAETCRLIQFEFQGIADELRRQRTDG